MRITFQYQSMYSKTVLQNSLAEQMKAQERVDAGQRLLSPDEDPSAYSAAYSISRMIRDSQRFAENASNADGWMDFTDGRIKAILDDVKSVRADLAIYGANSVIGDEAMQSLSTSVKQIYENLIDLANSEYLGRYIFSGFKTDTKPVEPKENQISQVVYHSGKGGALTARKVFGDLEELKSGNYRMEIIPKGGTGYLKLYDSNGNEVPVDTNADDDSTNGGNITSKEISFKLVPGAVINTGRGISITLPKDLNQKIDYEFEYSSGTDSSYFGDDGIIQTLIGFNQDVPINITGRELFYQSTKLIRGSKFNTSNGLAAGFSTLFSQLDKSKARFGDSITVKGTDHMGRSVGAGNLLGTENVKLNMTNSTKEERTLTLGYAGKYYQIEIPAKGYKDMEELTGVLNKELSKAVYVGKQGLISYEDVDFLENAHRAEVQGLIPRSGASYEVNLADDISVIADGGRLAFTTSTTGNMVTLSVSGAKNNTLGFDDKTIGAIGKNNVFNLGREFDGIKGAQSITVSHSNFDNNSAQANFVINGKMVNINNLPPSSTTEEKELLIDEALKRAGFGKTISSRIESNGSGGHQITFSLHNVNANVNTHLSSTYTTASGTDYKMAHAQKNLSGVWQDKSLGDYTKFIQNLYDDTVNAEIEDGRFVLRDLRGGDSKLSIDIQENNEGIGIVKGEADHILTGKYSGTVDSLWTIRATVTDNSGKCYAKVELLDADNRVITVKEIENYRGEEISLKEGVNIVLSDKGTTGNGTSNVSTFNSLMTGNTSLNFGDMNVVDNGTRKNAFISLKNLTEALSNGLVTTGIKEPSSWKEKMPLSTANPYFDGKFGGNYNAQFKYEVACVEGRNAYYLQNEFIKKTGTIRHDASMNRADFNINVYNNDTKQVDSFSLSVDLSSAGSSEDVTKLIVSAVNNNTALYDLGIQSYSENGKIIFKSGSGVQNIDLKPANKNSQYILGTSGESGAKKIAESSTETSSFNVNYYKNNAWVTKSVNINGYTDINDALAKINSVISPDVTASVSDGKLSFTPSSGVSAIYYDEVRGNGSLGINNNSLNYVSASSVTSLDLKSYSVDERTFMFHYNEGGDIKTRSIVVDNKEFHTIEELTAHINVKLNDSGLSTSIEAMAGENGRVMFKTSAAVTSLTVENDHSGKLGFAKSGDKLEIKVTDADGRSIQNVTAHTANELYSVADGILLGFDAGSLNIADSFTGKVGSGVRFEISVLDQVENQILNAYTKLGNHHARTKSVMAFQKSVTVQLQTDLAKNIGGTERDIVGLMTDLVEAKHIYEKAISLIANTKNISLFDYLR